jgi:exopolysaccharide production protein ExoY
VISIALLWIDGFPIYFRHTRIGRDGRSFDCIKFRTMVKDSEERLQALLQDDPARRKEWNDTYKLREDPRIHPLGAILRKSSLDELPQLVNVLKGDMSIVGPRPIVADEIARYRENFLTFASVRPGLTGLWQVSGRSDTSYPERVNLDVQYIRGIGLAQDLWILAKTVWVVIAGRGSV